MSYRPTRHNSADSVPTLNLVCIKEVTIRTTFCIAGIIYYTFNLVTDIQCTRFKKMPSTNVFNELCVKISLLRSIPKKIIRVCNAVYFRLFIDSDAHSSTSYSRGIRWLPSTEVCRMLSSPQHAQSVQADMKQTFSLILNFSACKRTILHRDSVSLMTKWILSHNNPCFLCNIAITNFLVSHTCEISFHDLIGQSTVPMYSSA